MMIQQIDSPIGLSPGWYLCDTETRGRTVTRAYFWDGHELRGYEGGHFLVEMKSHRNFRRLEVTQSEPRQ